MARRINRGLEPRTIRADRTLEHFRKATREACGAEPVEAYFVVNDAGIDSFMLRIGDGVWVYGHTRGDDRPYVDPERHEATAGREAWLACEVARAEATVVDLEQSLAIARAKRNSLQAMHRRERKGRRS